MRCAICYIDIEIVFFIDSRDSFWFCSSDTCGCFDRLLYFVGSVGGVMASVVSLHYRRNLFFHRLWWMTPLQRGKMRWNSRSGLVSHINYSIVSCSPIPISCLIAPSTPEMFEFECMVNWNKACCLFVLLIWFDGAVSIPIETFVYSLFSPCMDTTVPNT